MPRMMKFQPRVAQPLTPCLLSQSQQHQKQYVIPFAYLSAMPSLDKDADYAKMKADANSRSIDVKEDISNEMCRMLKLKAENWAKMMQQVSNELPGDLDHLDPLSYTKPLVKYASTFEGVDVKGKPLRAHQELIEVAPATPERGGITDYGMEGYVASSPAHDAILAAIEGYEDETTPVLERRSCSSNIIHEYKDDDISPGQNNNNNNMNNNKEEESNHSHTHSHSHDTRDRKKSESTLQKKDSQAAIEMKYHLLQKVARQLSEIAAENVLRGVPNDHLVYYPARKKDLTSELPAKKCHEPFFLEIELILKYTSAMIKLPLKCGQWKYFKCPKGGTRKLQRFLLMKASKTVFRNIFWYCFVKRYQLAQPRTLRTLAKNIGMAYAGLVSGEYLSEGERCNRVYGKHCS